MTTIPASLVGPLVNLLLAIADDNLMLGHRNSDWTGLAPILEEDIAFSSLSQDNIAHAMSLYEMAGELVGASADRLAFGREPEQYRCASIVELPDEFNWATAMAREFFCCHFDQLRFARLALSSHKPAAQLAERLKAEQRVQTEHIDGWIHRLGQGTDESNRRMQEAITALAPAAIWLFEPVESQETIEAEGLYPKLQNGAANMFDAWENRIIARTEQAGLSISIDQPSFDEPGGRRGAHTSHFVDLLDEMCEVYRLEPDATW